MVNREFASNSGFILDLFPPHDVTSLLKLSQIYTKQQKTCEVKIVARACFRGITAPCVPITGEIIVARSASNARRARSETCLDNLLCTCISILGIATLVIVGLLGVIRDFLSRSIFDATLPSSEQHAVEIADDARFPEPADNTN